MAVSNLEQELQHGRRRALEDGEFFGDEPLSATERVVALALVLIGLVLARWTGAI